MFVTKVNSSDETFGAQIGGHQNKKTFELSKFYFVGFNKHLDFLYR